MEWWRHRAGLDILVCRIKEAGVPLQGEKRQRGFRSEGVTRCYPRLRWKKPFRLQAASSVARS